MWGFLGLRVFKVGRVVFLRVVERFFKIGRAVLGCNGGFDSLMLLIDQFTDSIKRTLLGIFNSL